jgi:hypothetical protein
MAVSYAHYGKFDLGGGMIVIHLALTLALGIISVAVLSN